VAEAVIFNALNLAGADDVPEDAAGFVFFVLGSLDAAVERRAGRNAADAVLHELEPLLEDARQRVRASATTSGLAPKSQPGFPAVSQPPEDRSPASDPSLTESGVHPRVDSEPPAAEAVGPTSVELPPVQPQTQAVFLVASADARLRDALRRTLQRDGHRVVAAPDGHVGLALCVRYEPAVVICDSDMPRVTGKELVSSIKLALGCCSPRVIMLTPEPLEPIPDVFHQLPRPVHPDILKRVIDNALSAQ
jgi:hypothetical protein